MRLSKLGRLSFGRLVRFERLEVIFFLLVGSRDRELES